MAKTETIGGEEFVSDVAPQVQQNERLARVKAIGVAGKAFLGVLKELGSSRELSIARQRIEEAVMWATKHCIK